MSSANSSRPAGRPCTGSTRSITDTPGRCRRRVGGDQPGRRRPPQAILAVQMTMDRLRVLAALRGVATPPRRRAICGGSGRSRFGSCPPRGPMSRRDGTYASALDQSAAIDSVLR